jgi:ABC-type antimicrobial peptide transport system permease subunit
VGWVGVGLVIGIGLALLAGRAMRTVVYGVAPVDSTSLLGAAAVLGLAAVAALLPAWRAARTDPVPILRAEYRGCPGRTPGVR